MIRSKKITQSAKGEDCTLNIAGVCNYNPETVVFCHLPDEFHGMSHKASDVSGCFGCDACHTVIDGRVPHRFEAGEKEWYMRRGQTRTLHRLFALEVIRLA